MGLFCGCSFGVGATLGSGSGGGPADVLEDGVQDGEQVHGFEIDSALKEKMLKGMDDIDLTLAEAQLIRDFEVGHRQRQPWLFRN